MSNVISSYYIVNTIGDLRVRGHYLEWTEEMRGIKARHQLDKGGFSLHMYSYTRPWKATHKCFVAISLSRLYTDIHVCIYILANDRREIVVHVALVIEMVAPFSELDTLSVLLQLVRPK